MCGIAGIVAETFDQSIVPSMVDIMRHRGPDSRGFFVSEGVHLGHCRLSINDLSENASQPFVSREHRVSVAVNGEIYNFQELKNRLLHKGYVFRSNSDSEVALHGYVEYGIDFVRELNGMFAIAVWDGRSRMVFLIRDRLGIKPLYYAQAGSSFLFASEIKALAQYGGLDLSLDRQSFAEYMLFENYFSNRTLNRHIKMVEPGEIVAFTPGDGMVTRRYFWKPVFSGNGFTGADAVYERYFDVVRASVNRHLLSDVPVGSYLSSGFDSSSVLYCASRELGHVLRTYTGTFGMNGFYDESAEAAKTAESFGCPNRRVQITPADFSAHIEDVLWHLDEPRVGMGSFSQYMVAKYASQEVKVILTGHGGDEFFAGYPVFKAIYGKKDIVRLIAHSSRRELMFAIYFALYPLIRKEADFFLPNIYPFGSLRRILDSGFFNDLPQRKDVFGELENLKRAGGNEYERLTLTYLKLYLPALFVVEDRISMAFSLESRTPLCDNEMLDLALSIPLSLKLSGFELKHIPKTAMKGKLPSALYALPKRGFPTPLAWWFKNDLKAYVKGYILDNLPYLKMFRRKEVEKLIAGFQGSRVVTPLDEIEAHKLWIVLNLIAYFRNQQTRYRR